jgi:predicted nucleotidyltransferase
MDLISDLKEFVRLLDAHEVKYMIVGGAAVNVLGFIRRTEDLDFWLERSEDNAEKTLAALAEFGFEGEFAKADLLDPTAVLMLGRAPNRIGLLTWIAGREFADCYARRTYETLDGLRVPMISLDDLIINKKASGRTKDLADVEEFEKARVATPGDLDE